MLLDSLAAAQEQDPLAAPKSMNEVGFPALLYLWVISPDNPQSPAKVALGRTLFFDDRLSADGTISSTTIYAQRKGVALDYGKH